MNINSQLAGSANSSAENNPRQFASFYTGLSLNFLEQMTDEEYLDQISKIEIYCEILLGFLRYTRVRNYEDENSYKEILNRNLKFKNNDDHLRLRSCIDLIEDTQLAINEVYENGLSEYNDNNYGERYLKLYGVLNAVYQQKQATMELIELFKTPPKKITNKELNSLKIIDLRNKVGAHTSNHLSENEKVDAFRLTRTTVTKWADNLTIVSSYDELEEFDLVPLMREFTIKIELILDNICNKGLKSLFPNNSELKDWMVFRLEYVRDKKTAEQ